MPDVTSTISKFVKRRGICTKAIAENTGIPINALYKSFSGNRKLRADEYLAICKFLGKDPNDFYLFKSA